MNNDSIVIRPLPPEDVYRIHEIDRAEFIRRNCRYEDGALIWQEHNFQVPSWDDAQIDHLVNDLVQPALDQGATLLGAFDGETLAGIAQLGNRWLDEYPRQLQLVILYVSNGYRQQGIARRLMDEVCRRARAQGARSLYISATPSESAVGFYTSYGAVLAPTVYAELYAREPEDIHFILQL